jgi:hypothetical protein
LTACQLRSYLWLASVRASRIRWPVRRLACPYATFAQTGTVPTQEELRRSCDPGAISNRTEPLELFPKSCAVESRLSCRFLTKDRLDWACCTGFGGQGFASPIFCTPPDTISSMRIGIWHHGSRRYALVRLLSFRLRRLEVVPDSRPGSFLVLRALRVAP